MVARHVMVIIMIVGSSTIIKVIRWIRIGVVIVVIGY